MTPTNELPARLREIADGILFGRPSLVARQAADGLEELERELADRAESWRMSSVCRAKEAQIARLERELEQEREQVAILRSDEKRLMQFAKTYRLRADEAEAKLEQDRQDRKQAELDALRALGERNDARAQVEQIKTILADPLAVHLNMMRGTIKWTPANLRALLGDTEP